ncbi:response regulator [Duganella sp. FT80W]|uniref:Response regulator n=1 Tax=Duganella guangzhouensis TaxID=2666084 RepID=A0A6I2L2K0_9BURK|nr:response regulator [Duganella guangzhouensis]
MSRIALIEDHPQLAQLIQKALERGGMAADIFPSLQAAWPEVRDGQYHVLVVDRGLPDGDGLEIVRRLRAAQSSIPCMMLTARDALHDRVDGLESGADDYLAKPFEMDEFVARVRALSRRQPISAPAVLSYGDITLLPEEGFMVCATERVTLPMAEMQIMLHLTRSGGKTVRRTALELAAWGLAEAVTPNALDVALHRLRKKLEAIDSRLCIVNSRGLGYALMDQ